MVNVYSWYSAKIMCLSLVNPIGMLPYQNRQFLLRLSRGLQGSGIRKILEC